jgi:hypothetical protein
MVFVSWTLSEREVILLMGIASGPLLERGRRTKSALLLTETWRGALPQRYGTQPPTFLRMHE